MLHDFIIENRDRIIELAQSRVRERTALKASEVGAELGIPGFLSQLTDALALNALTRSRSNQPDNLGIQGTATRYGYDLMKNGFTVAQVVHGYGDVCQVVTELATHTDAAISPDDFRVFNRCLDDAIAGAVTAFQDQREVEIAYEGTERIGVLAHEMRNLLNTAILSFEVLTKGMVGIRGSTGTIHARSLADLRLLVERSLTEVRLEAGVPRLERTALAEFVEPIRATAALQAEAHHLFFTVGPMDDDVVMEVDRQLLSSALNNLIQNAFKFSKAHGNVLLSAHVTQERISIEVADSCGGLPPGRADEIFRPFTRRSSNHSGLGLGLSIARNAIRASGGELAVRDVPGTGCVFTIDLPCVPR
jgi:signal transduction histidine kinase